MNTVYLRNASIEAAPLQLETILLNPENNQFCMLNPSASFLWNQLDHGQSADAIAEAICSRFSGVSMDIALADVQRALQQLHSLKFVTVENREAGGEGKEARPPLSAGAKPPERPPYESPRLTAMKEDEVLSAFQVPVVATTWWG